MISVIMPAYNAQRFIKESIESILNQTYKDFELIIIDDGSTDQTREVIETYTDKRIIYSKNNENKGIAYTTNRGIEIASGDYIALLDDDDIAEPNRLELQINYLETNKEIDVLGGRTILIDVDGNEYSRMGEPRKNPKYIKTMLLFQSLDFANSTVMYRKSFIQDHNLRYRDGYLGMQDYQFYVECSKCGNISSIGDFLLKHRVHDGCESKRQLEHNSMERSNLYSKIRRDSLESSGFDLDINDYSLIDKIFPEAGDKCENGDDWIKMGRVIDKILYQAREMKVDYYDELSYYCRKRWSKLLIKTDYFSNNSLSELWKNIRI